MKSLRGSRVSLKQNDLNHPPGDGNINSASPVSLTSSAGFSQAHDELTLREILSCLFPPFRETGPVLLAQIDNLMNKQFDGKVDRFLNEFLLQAKPLLQMIRDEAKHSLLNRDMRPAILPEGLF